LHVAFNAFVPIRSDLTPAFQCLYRVINSIAPLSENAHLHEWSRRRKSSCVYGAEIAICTPDVLRLAHRTHIDWFQKMVIKAKQEYISPKGYATRNRWSLMERTVVNSNAEEYVDHMIAKTDKAVLIFLYSSLSSRSIHYQSAYPKNGTKAIKLDRTIGSMQ